MARLALSNNAPMIATHLDPTNGANQIETLARWTPGGTSNNLESTRPSAMENPWIRLRRVGDEIIASHSGDGTNWATHARTGSALCGQLPPTLLVGVFATPNNGNNGNTTTAEFQNFQITAPGYMTQVSISSQPQGGTYTNCGSSITFTVGLIGDGCLLYEYYWLHNGGLIRPSQDCSVRYGYAINFNRIITLTETDYAETCEQIFKPPLKGPILATHTFNSMAGLTVIDAKRRRRKF